MSSMKDGVCRDAEVNLNSGLCVCNIRSSSAQPGWPCRNDQGSTTWLKKDMSLSAQHSIIARDPDY